MICCAAMAIILIVLLVLILLPKRTLETQVSEPIVSEHTPHEATIPPTTEPVITATATISGISVEGMTKQQAMDAVRKAVSEYESQTAVTLSAGGQTMTLTAEEAGVHWDIEKAVSAACSGTSGIISLELTMDKDAVMDALHNFFDTLGGVYVPSGYWLEGEAPDIQQLSEIHQTLVINPGSAGYGVDLQGIYEQLLDAFEQGLPQISLDSLGALKEPAPLSLERIYNSVTTPPQNPSVNPQTLEIIPGKSGYGFDQEKAALLLESAQPGESIRVSMEYLSPCDEADAWFQDTLGYYKTEYADNENRTENLRLACSKLNGLILQPGEVLSYNETLGKRTTAAGYKPAPAYAGTELVDEVGGGICQVSSTLYLSSLFAELTVVDRRNHGYPVSYIPLGLDATVNWGTTDLKLRNDHKLPVKILAEVSDGFVKIRIMGVEQRDYYVKMEYRVDDHPDWAAAFRCRYDRETGEEIYRALDHTSIYLEDVWCEPGYAECSLDDTIG